MALRTRNISAQIKKAEARLEAMKEIDKRYDKKINYGGTNNPLTQTELEAQVNECRRLINEYNRILETADNKSKEIKEAEDKLGELFTRVLAGGKSIFGVDSEIIDRLGGTRKSERKKRKH